MTSTSFGIYFTLIQTVLELQQKPTNTTAVCSILFPAIYCNSHNIHRRSVVVFNSTKRISEQRFHHVSIRDITAWVRLRKIWKTSHDNRCPDRDSNRKRPECKPQVSRAQDSLLGRHRAVWNVWHVDSWQWPYWENSSDVAMKIVCCGMTPWSLVETYRRFGGSFLHA
jgi:hypothetical protein